MWLCAASASTAHPPPVARGADAPIFSLHAVLRDESTVQLLGGLRLQEQGHFLEQRIEERRVDRTGDRAAR